MSHNGALVRRTRITLGYGLSELARELDIDKSHLSRFERDIEGLSPKNLKKIADKLNLPIHHIVPELAEAPTA